MTDTADTSTPSPTSLGIGMSHRARTQTVLAQRWSTAGSVGAVGRASVGFGLAVGRSRAIRPTVSFDDLNSAALRPSVHAWNLRHGEPEPDAVTVSPAGAGPSGNDTVTAGAPQPGRASRHRRDQRVPAGGTGARSRLVRRRAPEARRPTWTDQVIQRSAIGYTAPPISSAPITEVPDDFVPFGDPKVDQLRLLLRRREEAERGGTGAASAAVATEGTVTEAARNRAPAARAEPSSLRDRGGRRGDTAAGRSTGPGQFARSMRPEPVDSGGVPAAAAISSAGTPTAPSPTAPMPTGRSAPRASSAPDVVRRQPAARGRSARPDKMESLRAMLVEQGVLAPEPDAAATSGRTGSAADETGAARRADPAPGSPPSADAVRATDRGRRSDTSAELRRAAAGRTPSTDATRAARPTPATSMSPDTGPAQRSAPSAPRPGGSTGSSAASSTGAVNTSATTTSGSASAIATSGDVSGTTTSASSSLSPAAASHPGTTSAFTRSSTASDVDPGRAGSDDGGLIQRSSAPLPDRGVATPAVAQRLRSQRLLTTGLAPIARGLAEVDSPGQDDALRRESGTTLVRSYDDPQRRHAGEREPLPVAVSPVATSASIDAPPPERDTFRETAGRTERQVVRRLELPRPALPDALGVFDERSPDSGTVLRRVTLPRALSSSHRPPTMMAQHEPTVPGRASTISSVRQRAVARDPRAATGAPASTIAGRAVPLLDVVRRHAVGRTAAALTERPEDASRPAGVGAMPAGSVDTGPRSASGTSSHAAAVIQRSAGVSEPSTSTANAAPVERPAERVAAQFMTELARTVRSRPAPLPASFRPLADSIAGPRPVMLSTDTASRRALRSVGKVAATTGDTIHLDRSAIPGAKLAEVMAHELTHVAAPSPAPRFFDDIDDSPEERRAERIGKVMGRSPLAPSASVVAPTTGSRSAVVRRSPARRSSPSAPETHAAPSNGGGAPTVSAASLAASLVNRSSSSGNSSPVIRRWETAKPDTSKQRSDVAIGSNRAPQAHGYDLGSDPNASAWFEEQLQSHLQPLLRMIEDRMIVEVERRGGRTWRMS